MAQLSQRALVRLRLDWTPRHPHQESVLLGWFFFVGAIVWFVKVNGALNAYWRSQGAC